MRDQMKQEVSRPARGGRLDRQKKAEFLASLGAAEWQDASWPKWTVTGRVLPERCNVSIAPKTLKGVGQGGKVVMTAEVVSSLICARCAFETASPSVFEIASMVRAALSFPVDYVAYANRGAYEIILDLCIEEATNVSSTIPIFEPTFVDHDHTCAFDPAEAKGGVDVPYDAANTTEFVTALHDLTSAVKHPGRTFEHCRMGMEAVRSHFDPPDVKGWKKRWIAGELKMCETLKVERSMLASLEAIAARSRHGEAITSMTWPMRKQALEFSWEVVARFRDHLRGKPSDNWPPLKGTIE
jgi:hypothetical protein